MQIDDKGVVAHQARIDDGLILTIIRHPNPNNALTVKNVAKFVSGIAKISENKVTVNVPEGGRASPFPAAGEYPFAAATYETVEDGKKLLNYDMFFFPSDSLFLFHLQAESEALLDKHDGDLEKWVKTMKFVEK